MTKTNPLPTSPVIAHYFGDENFGPVAYSATEIDADIKTLRRAAKARTE